MFDVSWYDLAATCDIRNSVIATVLAYLETDGIIEARGVFYSNYRLKLMRPLPQILAGHAPAERKFLDRLLNAGTPGRSWLGFDPGSLAETLKVSRDRIVAALGAIEAAGDAALSLSGVRHAYRMKKDPGDLRLLAARYAEMFKRREQADLERLGQVVGLSAQRGCLTGYLTRHFGEKLAAPCGHCDRCRGLPAATLKRTSPRRVGDEEWGRIRRIAHEGHPALGNARQLARFLCGMSSPASMRARLNRHDAFGMLADLPFSEVLAIAGALADARPRKPS
jgi:ATP-dependent DNA helicase RecQ